MKTTIDIADSLLADAKRLARAQQRTLRDVVEDGLRRALEDRKPEQPFRLRRHAFHGQGTQPGVAEGDWDTIRSLIYRM